MDRQSFLNLINNSVKELEKNYTDDSFKQIQNKFKNYLKDNPSNIEIWIKYSLLFYCIRYDELETMKILANALSHDPDHIVAKLIICYVIIHTLYPNIEVFEIASSIKTTNLEYLSMQEYTKSWYYDLKNKKMHKKSLLASIEYCNTFVWNYKHLGLYYLHEEKNYKEAGYCFQKALNNVQRVYKLTEHYDPLNIEEFMNERLKGIHLTEPNFESLQSLLESCK